MYSTSNPHPYRDHLVMALLAGTVLLYEIAITRLLSVVLWYHFAFLSVSLAMVGLGVPGVWYALRRPRPDSFHALLLAAGLAIPASIIWIVQVMPSFPGARWMKVGATAIAILLPLFLLGAAVCRLLLEAAGRRIGRMYAADLFGATLGACLVVPLMHVIPTPILLAGLGLLPLLAAALIADRRRAMPLVLATALVLSLVWGEPYRLRYNKSYSETEASLLYEKWSPLARLAVFPGIMWSPDPGLEFGWGMGSKWRGQGADQRWIDQDGSAGTAITRLQGSPDDLEHLFFDVTSLGFQLRPPRSVCIIGAGGGRDILTALKAGAKRVDAVELNPYMIDIATNVFGEYSGHVYQLPGVEAVVSEGRSFLTGTEHTYDLIQISMIDSWAATTAGAYALSENYLYTVEALELYLERLNENGLVSISRWMAGRHQLEGARLVLLAQEALGAAGYQGDPLEHLAVYQGGRLATALLSPRPFSRAEITDLDTLAEERGFVRHWPPSSNTADKMIAHVLLEGPGSLEATGFYLAPPYDDAPFFFQNVRAWSLIDSELLKRFSINEGAAVLPRFLILFMTVLTLALFFSPFALVGRLERGEQFWRGSAYFLAIGLGFMLIEIPFLQKFILYLGHPSYATPVVLGTLLLGSGIGSFLAGQLDFAVLSRLRWLLPVIAALVNLVLPMLFSSTLGWSFAGRVGMSLALIGPLGLVFGFAFPVGMISFGDVSKAWYWALNGAASVLANVAALALAAYVGLTQVVWIGVCCYLAACLALPRSSDDVSR